MAVKLVKLTSIITVMLVVLMGLAFCLGLETNHYEMFWSVVQFTFCFTLLVGVWYLIAPPHRNMPRRARKS